jgi:hypothetical protein
MQKYYFSDNYFGPIQRFTLLPDLLWLSHVSSQVGSRHDHVTAKHHGKRKAYELISKDYQWPGMRQYINEYVRSGLICQLQKLKSIKTLANSYFKLVLNIHGFYRQTPTNRFI